jgi:hypothetical protein
MPDAACSGGGRGRSAAHLVPCLLVGAALHQQRDALNVTVLCGAVQRREAILRASTAAQHTNSGGRSGSGVSAARQPARIAKRRTAGPQRYSGGQRAPGAKLARSRSPQPRRMRRADSVIKREYGEGHSITRARRCVVRGACKQRRGAARCAALQKCLKEPRRPASAARRGRGGIRQKQFRSRDELARTEAPTEQTTRKHRRAGAAPPQRQAAARAQRARATRRGGGRSAVQLTRLLIVWMSAPRSTSSCTTPKWPLNAAHDSGACSYCVQRAARCVSARKAAQAGAWIAWVAVRTQPSLRSLSAPLSSAARAASTSPSFAAAVSFTYFCMSSSVSPACAATTARSIKNRHTQSRARTAHVVCRLLVGAAVHQQRHALGMPPHCSAMQRRVAKLHASTAAQRSGREKEAARRQRSMASSGIATAGATELLGADEDNRLEGTANQPSLPRK